MFLNGLLNLLKPRLDWCPLGVKFKISDEHPRLFHMGAPPPPGLIPQLTCILNMTIATTALKSNRALKFSQNLYLMNKTDCSQ